MQRFPKSGFEPRTTLLLIYALPNRANMIVLALLGRAYINRNAWTGGVSAGAFAAASAAATAAEATFFFW